ncbi:kinetochore protein CHL4 like-domain-containing protein [Phascolomyces articulosus]|uniref:Kinetochore protein CHL4 like-domain-containing protein n=1 Tax=Phascolomyces articulosus TaxID=60185 RepID=A0AAD5PFP1_9FUNG|nr:kinetochore protein CHL4 like-domain-containing protein [Phascolomyces articulosus]
MQLSQSDLQVVEYDAVAKSLLRKATTGEIFESVKEWFQHPELKPANPTSNWIQYEIYQGKRAKSALVNRLYQDWPDGLTMYQMATLDIKNVISRRLSPILKLWEVKGDSARVDKSLEAYTARDQLYKQLSVFYKCHILVETSDEEQVDWFRIAIFETRDQKNMPSYSQTINLARFRDTPYIAHVGSVRVALVQLIQQLCASVYGGERIEQLQVAEHDFNKIATVAKHHKALGTFSRFLGNGYDSNPLDLREQLSKRPKEQEYVTGRERRRRIVPLDRELIQGRYRQTTETFGTQVVQGLNKAVIHMDTSMKDIVDPSITETISEDELKMKMKVTIKGTNVMEGFRQLSLRGIMKAPIPPWIMDMAAQGINTVYVTEDGVLREELVDDDDNNNEQDKNDHQGQMPIESSQGQEES